MKLAVFLPIAAFIAQFQTVSITPSQAGAASSRIHFDNGTLSVENATLKACLQFAYDVKDYQVQGPAWIEASRYDIHASGPRPKTEAQAAQMLQALLTERFKLALHHETRTLPVYELVLAATGPKLQPARGRGENDRLGNTELSAEGIGMAQLAELLSRRLDRPVIDKTGLSGAFDLDLKWADTSIFAALEAELGLKLEAAKGPVDILVIDHVEQPDGK